MGVALLVWSPWSSNGPASPTAVSARSSTATSVRLTWAPGSGGPAVDNYVVVRDGRDVATVPQSVTSYVDRALTPATTFRYQVVALSGTTRSDPSAVVVVRTAIPPVAAARLQGVWTVSSKVVRSGGGNVTVGTRMTDSWQIRPRCATGPCAVSVSAVLSGGVFTPHPFRVTLLPNAGVYRGSTSAHVTHCGGLSVTNTIHAWIRITRAGVVHGVWAARAWVGGETIVAPYTSAGGLSYCPAQSLSLVSHASH